MLWNLMQATRHCVMNTVCYALAYLDDKFKMYKKMCPLKARHCVLLQTIRKFCFVLVVHVQFSDSQTLPKYKIGTITEINLQ